MTQTAPDGPGVIPERLASSRPSVSFEFFPPKDDEGERVLWEAIERLRLIEPDFVSITYGAGGTSQDRTVRVTEQIRARTGLTPLAHLTCVGQSVTDLERVVGEYAAAGVTHILALRGDPPGDVRGRWVPHPDGLSHAEDLVALLRERGGFAVGVAAFPDRHPESASFEEDVETLVRKHAAGATFAITQMVFDPESYLRLRDAVAARCEMPVTPGIMPVTNLRQIQRMSELMGTPLPAPVLARLEAAAGDAERVRAVGMDIAAEHADRMLAEGAPGLHFITMNRSTATVELHGRLARWWGEGVDRPAG